jgi:hypothetical protein
VDKNISTIVDLLEDRGISWSNYNEGLPYSGFQGFRYENPTEGNYERKHDLLARFDSIRLDPHRASRVKNLTLYVIHTLSDCLLYSTHADRARFYDDLRRKVFPQWAFLTPNLHNDGHDTNISTSCAWVRRFVQPLLKDTYFNKNALIYITWQADGQNPAARNHVAGIILGNAVPPKYVGTVDDSYYNHYSQLSTVEANWGLHHLGRWDVGANVWKVVGEHTGDEIRYWNESIAGGSFESYYWNQSYGGVFSSGLNTTHTYVAPNVDLTHNGRTILPKIKELWGSSPAEWNWGWHMHGNRWPGNNGRPPAVGHGFKGHRLSRRDDWAGKGWGGKGWGGKGWGGRDWHGDNWKHGNWGDDNWNDPRHHDNHDRYGGGRLPEYYRDNIELPDDFHPPTRFEVKIPLPPGMPVTTPITAYPYDATPSPQTDMSWMSGTGKM